MTYTLPMKSLPPLPPEDIARQRGSVARLRELLCQIPFYAAKARKPNADRLFIALYGSCVLAPPRTISKRYFETGPVRKGLSDG
jgi:hypothetical protein